MTRTFPLSIAAVGLAAALLVVVGCSSKRSDPSGETSEVMPTAAKAESPKDKRELFQNWPNDTLLGAVILSGEQIGYLEPCGCTAGQKGGLGRRLDLIHKLEKQGWKLAKLDLGSLINDPNTNGGPQETRIRYTYGLKALQAMDYDAIALSADGPEAGGRGGRHGLHEPA